MSFKYLILIFAFILLPNVSLANSHLAVASISDIEKSEMNQDYELPRESVVSNTEDKINISEINNESNLSPVNYTRLMFFIIVVVFIIITIRVVL